MKFTIGSDPEAFILSEAVNSVVSAKRFTVGTKDVPEDMGDGYALMNDNILIEGNVPPSRNRDEFIASMTKLHDMISERASRRFAKQVNSDAMEISTDLARTKEAREFGCSSFRDAWNGFLEISTPVLLTNWRSAGCHIHIGFEEERDNFKMAVVRAFDMLVTVPAIEETGFNYRTSNLYGLLGAARITSYGVECRSLGGSFFRKESFGWIYDKVEQAIALAEEKEDQIMSLPEITTYVGRERFEIIKQYIKKVL